MIKITTKPSPFYSPPNQLSYERNFIPLAPRLEEVIYLFYSFLSVFKLQASKLRDNIINELVNLNINGVRDEAFDSYDSVYCDGHYGLDCVEISVISA